MNKHIIIKIISSILLFFSTVSFAKSNTFKQNEIITKDVQNVVILGGGIGALTSGIYLSRAGYTPLVIEGELPGGLITQAHLVENWPGEYQISGANLAEKLKSHAEKNGCQFLSKEVIDVNFSKKPYFIIVRDLYRKNQIDKIYANSCIIAMGTSSNHLNIQGEKEYWGKGVSNCAVCDGSLYEDKKVAIIGGGDAAVVEANYLSNLAKEVTILVRKNTLKATDKLKIKAMNEKNNIKVFYNTRVISINGNKENVKSLTVFDSLKNQKYNLDVEGVFLAIGSKPNTQIFKNKLKLDKNGYIKVNDKQQTSVTDVYAIGDIVDPIYKQAVTAAGDGAKAAILCQKSLEDKVVTKKHSKVVSERALVSNVIEIINVQQFENEMNSKDSPILIDFYASWCGPCKRIAPMLESYAKILQGKVKILKVNVKKLQDIASKYKIKAMPTIIVFDKEGNILFKKMGTNDISSILYSLEQIKDKSIEEIENYLQEIE